MYKVLVTLYIVSIDKSFDVLLPINMTINDVLQSIQDSIVDLSNGNYVINDKASLYNVSGHIINPGNIVKYSGIKNGEILCLI